MNEGLFATVVPQKTRFMEKELTNSLGADVSKYRLTSVALQDFVAGVY